LQILWQTIRNLQHHSYHKPPTVLCATNSYDPAKRFEGSLKHNIVN